MTADAIASPEVNTYAKSTLLVSGFRGCEMLDCPAARL